MSSRDRRRYSAAGGTTIPTAAGNTDHYVIAPVNGVLIEALFSAIDALAAHDTNYVTFAITNLGQAGAGTNAMLGAVDGNTSKATGGSAIAANTKRALTLNTDSTKLKVVAGDRLRIRVTGAGTLANTVTGPNFLLTFQRTL